MSARPPVPRNSRHEYAGPNFNPTSMVEDVVVVVVVVEEEEVVVVEGEDFGRAPRPESTNSGERASAQCQHVIHLNTVKLKAVYCSRRPFILLNAGARSAHICQ